MKNKKNTTAYRLQCITVSVIIITTALTVIPYLYLKISGSGGVCGGGQQHVDVRGQRGTEPGHVSLMLLGELVQSVQGDDSRALRTGQAQQGVQLTGQQGKGLGVVINGYGRDWD